jgi:hypothetical protein
MIIPSLKVFNTKGVLVVVPTKSLLSKVITKLVPPEAPAPNDAEGKVITSPIENEPDDAVTVIALVFVLVFKVIEPVT